MRDAVIVLGSNRELRVGAESEVLGILGKSKPTSVETCFLKPLWGVYV